MNKTDEIIDYKALLDICLRSELSFYASIDVLCIRAQISLKKQIEARCIYENEKIDAKITLKLLACHSSQNSNFH